MWNNTEMTNDTRSYPCSKGSQRYQPHSVPFLQRFFKGNANLCRQAVTHTHLLISCGGSKHCQPPPASAPQPAARCRRETPGHSSHQGQSWCSAATSHPTSLSQHTPVSLGARSGHLLFLLTHFKLAWELLAKRWHRKSMTWTNASSHHSKTDEGAPKLLLFSSAICGNRQFPLQQPVLLTKSNSYSLLKGSYQNSSRG